MTLPLLVNQLQAISVRLVTPWDGVWFADADVVLDETEIVPFGPCSLTVGSVVYVGTVDPHASGKFGKSAKIRILAGGGGWSKLVLPMHFSSPATVLSTTVYAATAAEVGEVVVDSLPKPLGKDFVRFGGLPLVGPPRPASAIFEGVDWYVTPQGITTVGPRIPLPYNPVTTEVLSFEPRDRTLTVASDEPITPGTIFLDPLRFSGALTARDVEQTWSAEGGARATIWCAEEKGSRLQTALSNLVAAKSGLAHLKTYRYRIVLQEPDESLILQNIDPASGAPDAIPFPMWMGVPGVGAKVLPGSEVLVTFTADNPPRPAVVGFEPGRVPLLIEFGESSKGPIAMATGTQAQIAALEAQIAAITAWIAAVTALAALPPTSTTFTLFGLAMAAPGATVAGLSAAQIPVIAANVLPATSTLLVSD